MDDNTRNMTLMQPTENPPAEPFLEEREHLAIISKMAGMFSTVCSVTQADYDKVLLAYRSKCSECEELKKMVHKLSEQLAATTAPPADAHPLFRTDKYPMETCLTAFNEVIQTSKNKQVALKDLFSPAFIYINIRQYTNKVCAQVLNNHQDTFLFTESDISKARSAN